MLNFNDVEKELSGLYLTIIGRSPDADGVSYWVNEVMSEKLTVAQVGQSFFDQPEVIEKYTNLNNESFIRAVYQNVLGRDAEDGGFNYWKNELDNNTISKDRFIEAINNGATGDDAIRLKNLKDVGYTYMKNIGTDIELSSTILTNVTKDSSSVEQALKIIQYYSNNSSSIQNTDQQSVNSWISSGITNNCDITRLTPLIDDSCNKTIDEETMNIFLSKMEDWEVESLVEGTSWANMSITEYITEMFACDNSQESINHALWNIDAFNDISQALEDGGDYLALAEQYDEQYFASYGVMGSYFDTFSEIA